MVALAAKHPDAQPDVINAKSSSVTTYITDIALKYEPYFAVRGREVRLSAEKFKESWLRLALGHGPLERLFAVSLGYVIFGLAVAVYLNLLTVGTARSAGRAVRSAVRQQLLVLKVLTPCLLLERLIHWQIAGCGVYIH
jgi:E3 ubiquitin-protein ligase MARCH6